MIPKLVAQFVALELRKQKPARVFVPFAGNFVIEQLATLNVPGAEIHSTDVNIYSLLLGYGLTGKECDIRLNERAMTFFPFFRGKDSPEEKAAIALFLSDAADAIQKAEKYLYYEKLAAHSIHHQEEYFLKCLGNIRRTVANIKNMVFYGLDACELLLQVRPGDFVYYDSPTIKGGYKNMFSAMEDLYEFTPPPYTEITDAVRFKHLEDMEAKGALTYFNCYHPQNWIKELPAGYREVFRWSNSYEKWVGVFSNCSETSSAVKTKFLADREEHYKVIGPEDEITKKTKIKFLPVKGDVMNHYRLMWVKKADVKAGAYNWLIFAAEKLIGGVVIGSGAQFGVDLALIVSDPAAPTSKYARLSRLIVELVCTEEMLKVVNEISMWPHTGFTTVVFTEHQVSMKYRGLFDLVKRETIKGGKYPLKLTYQNRDHIKRTFKEALSNWIDKNGEKGK